MNQSIERASLLKQVRCSRHDFEVLFTMELGQCRSLSLITSTSFPPTMSIVGALTRVSAAAARSGELQSTSATKLASDLDQLSFAPRARHDQPKFPLSARSRRGSGAIAHWTGPSLPGAAGLRRQLMGPPQTWEQCSDPGNV